MVDVAKGLAGVVVEETAVSEVCAEGELSYRGFAIGELVSWTLPEVASLVVTGAAGESFEELLRRGANLEDAESRRVLAMSAHLHPMQALQSVVPMLSRSPERGFGEADQGLHVAAKLPAVVATHLCRKAVTVDDSLDYAARFLSAIEVEPTAELVEAFNVTQILQVEHGFNAGTFAARVVASALAPVEAAIAAGIGALSGPLHGGADEAVLNIADTLTSPEAARQEVDNILAAGGKLPGMGHREYRARDPRARHLEAWVQKLTSGTPHERTYEILRAMDNRFSERMAERGKPLDANVEFYKGLVYRVLGLPNQFFTAGFAMARVFGYVAHFIESRQDNRIYRPAAQYVGPRHAPASIQAPV